MAVTQSARLVELDRAGPVALCVAETEAPWSLDIDAMVLSVGASGLGSLGYALQAARPDVRLPSADELTELTPRTPMVVPVGAEFASRRSSGSAATGPSSPADGMLRLVVLATVQGIPRDSNDPVVIATVVDATVAAVVGASESGASSIGVPLLGTGFIGLDPTVVAPAVLAALRDLYKGAVSPAPNRLVLFAPDAATVHAIRDGWLEVIRGVQLTMVADLPIEDPRLDILGTNAYAEALAFVIDHQTTSTPLTVAINAPWGAGKTSVAKLTERRLQTFLMRSREPITCWFNAWHHDDAPHIATALASVVARSADAHRPPWRRWVVDPLPSQMLTPQGRRRRWFMTSLAAVVVALLVLAISGAFHTLTSGKLTLTVLVTLGAAALREWSTVRGTAAQLSSLVRAPETALASGSVDEVRSDLGQLIRQATRRGTRLHSDREHRRFIVFIDDLERCQPERSIEVCETVSTMLSHEDVIVVLIGDMQTLATAAEAKYKALAPRYRTGTLSGPSDNAASSFGELYLEKIVQFRFDLPTHELPALMALAHRLEERIPAGDPTSGPNPRAGRLRSRYRDWRTERRLRTQTGPALSWEARHADPNAARDYSSKLTELESLLHRTEGPSLQRSFDAVATLVRPLPRDLKRLLNRIRFYLYLLERRGVLAPAGPVPPEAVGKWALLAERWPDLAVAISANPSLLGTLENDARTLDGFMEAMGREVPGYARSAELQRLLVSRPPLGRFATCLSRLTGETTT